MEVLFKRIDGTFVVRINGLPYHVTESDPLFAEAEIAGASAPQEPVRPGPTINEIRAGMRLSRRQLLTALALEGLISAAEAVAWAASNTLPAAIEAMVAALPTPEAQTAARITLASFTVAERLDPMVPMLAAVAPVPLTDDQLDAFFTGYAAL